MVRLPRYTDGRHLHGDWQGVGWYLISSQDEQALLPSAACWVGLGKVLVVEEIYDTETAAVVLDLIGDEDVYVWGSESRRPLGNRGTISIHK